MCKDPVAEEFGVKGKRKENSPSSLPLALSSPGIPSSLYDSISAC